MNPEENGQTERIAPESLRLRTISPSLTVGDLDTSLAWYRDVIGFHVSQLWEHEGKVLGADLVAGAANLLIGQDDFKKGRDRVKGVGMRLYLTTTQPVDDVAEAIKSRGGILDSEPQDMPWGGRAFSIKDPDGFNITISSGE
jgi:uncharacterized glyoxalase superfamily protein PhnB